ncbi:MAG: hypothetical protein AAGH73_05740, partial [Pseudomonadota bacterium]
LGVHDDHLVLAHAGRHHLVPSIVEDRGQTASNSFKPAILDNGVKVMVPPFVGQDEMIIVNTETMEYSERA